MHILIFDIKVKKYTYFQWFFAKFLTLYSTTPKRPNSQSDNMAWNVSYNALSN